MPLTIEKYHTSIIIVTRKYKYNAAQRQKVKRDELQTIQRVLRVLLIHFVVLYATSWTLIKFEEIKNELSKTGDAKLKSISTENEKISQERE